MWISDNNSMMNNPKIFKFYDEIHSCTYHYLVLLMKICYCNFTINLCNLGYTFNPLTYKNRLLVLSGWVEGKFEYKVSIVSSIILKYWSSIRRNCTMSYLMTPLIFFKISKTKVNRQVKLDIYGSHKCKTFQGLY